jgi:hypothetical protein
VTAQVGALSQELDASRQRVHEALAEGARRAEDVTTLRQQLGRCQRELAVATTGSDSAHREEGGGAGGGADGAVLAPSTPPQSSEARVGRMRDWFEAELSRMVSAGTTDERLKVLSTCVSCVRRGHCCCTAASLSRKWPLQEMARQLTSAKLLEDELRMQVFALQQHKDALLTDAVVLKDVIGSLESDLVTANANRASHGAGASSKAEIDALVVGVGVSLSYETTVGELRTELEVERQRSRQLAARLSELQLEHEAAQQQVAALRAELPASAGDGVQQPPWQPPSHGALERQHQRTVEELEARLHAQSVQLAHARKQAAAAAAAGQDSGVAEASAGQETKAPGTDAHFTQGARRKERQRCLCFMHHRLAACRTNACRCTGGAARRIAGGVGVSLFHHPRPRRCSVRSGRRCATWWPQHRSAPCMSLTRCVACLGRQGQIQPKERAGNAQLDGGGTSGDGPEVFRRTGLPRQCQAPVETGREAREGSAGAAGHTGCGAG